MSLEQIAVTFKFKIGDQVRMTSDEKSRHGLIASRSYYESRISELSGIQYSIDWYEGGFTVPVKEDDIEVV